MKRIDMDTYPRRAHFEHALADGLHMAKFYEQFDKQIKRICEEGA